MREGWVYQQSRGEFRYIHASQVTDIVQRHTDEHGTTDREYLFAELGISPTPISSFGADGSMVINIHRCDQELYKYVAIIEYETDDDMLMIQSFDALVVWMQKMTPMLDMALKTAQHRMLIGR